MTDISIKIKIWDRIYPMKIDKKDEEIIRNSAKKLNQKISEYQEKFNLNDKQDLLAIICFDCFLELLKIQNKSNEESENLSLYLESLEEKITNVL